MILPLIETNKKKMYVVFDISICHGINIYIYIFLSWKIQQFFKFSIIGLQNSDLMAKSLVIFHYKNDLKQLKFHLTFGLAFSDKRNSFRMSVDILVSSCYFMYITEPKRKKVSKFVVFSLSFFFSSYLSIVIVDTETTYLYLNLLLTRYFFFFLKAT